MTAILETMQVNEGIRYEPDEQCPLLVSIGVGFQGTMLAVAPAVVNVAIVFLAAGESESYLSWPFRRVGDCGVTTALQAARIGRLGAGHVLIMGPGPIFIAICVIALVEGGPAMMASLVIVSSLFQFPLAVWLPLLRRIVTPVVSGTVLMLIASTVVPIALDLLDNVPEGSPGGGCSDHRRGYLDSRDGAGAARFRGLAAMVAAHRNRSGQRSRRTVRAIRRSTSDRSALVWHSPWRMGRIRPNAERRVLGAPAGVPDRDLGARHQQH